MSRSRTSVLRLHRGKFPNSKDIQYSLQPHLRAVQLCIHAKDEGVLLYDPTDHLRRSTRVGNESENRHADLG